MNLIRFAYEERKKVQYCFDKLRELGLDIPKDSREFHINSLGVHSLQPKIFIPELFNIWTRDVDVLKDKEVYKDFPKGIYEIVTNDNPPRSYYNSNNPDWVNVFIFYHVGAHIDFFRSNNLFRNTWKSSFAEKAKEDSEYIRQLRYEQGELAVDYILESAMSIENLVNFYGELDDDFHKESNPLSEKLEFFFDTFLQKMKKEPDRIYHDFIDQMAAIKADTKEQQEGLSLQLILDKYPEFETVYEKEKEKVKPKPKDLLQYIMQNSPKFKEEGNEWMINLVNIIRDTSLYFAPQGRTKIMNEGWATFWHQTMMVGNKDLGIKGDPALRGHETSYAIIDAGVTAMREIGFNPYGVGVALMRHILNNENMGRYSKEYKKLENHFERLKFNSNKETGLEYLLEVRKKFSDVTFINQFIDQDFVDINNLAVIDQRHNQQTGKIEYFIKSKLAKDYKNMILDQLAHNPTIEINEARSIDGRLYLKHKWEDRMLIPDKIHGVVAALEYLWGGPVYLETREKRQNQQTGQVDVVKVRHARKDKKYNKIDITS